MTTPWIEDTPLYSIDPHEFTAILLGTGTPRAYPGAAKPAVAVVVAGRILLFDCGADTVRQLIDAGLMPQRVRDVFFTHHHYDHNAGFPDLFISSWRTHVGVVAGRAQPMRVFGPTRTQEVIGRFHHALEYDIGLRISYNKSDLAGAELHITERNTGIMLDEDGLRVTAFEVDHRPVEPAVGYRIEWQGRVLVISGDTRPVPNTVVQASGADVLIHDAYNAAWLADIRDQNPELAIQVTNPAKYHTTTLEAAQVAHDAGVRHLVLTHHIPAPKRTAEAEARYTAGMAEIYAGQITVGRDLMRVSV
ncbi:MBL fold metallo-hydrolase [Deinococcus aquatilis]|uniref:MBL fold metallo-hydrolase n=1 Tax=Deinococcus aquatilis TaxID=519440 RepID=UPI000361FA21|nr:MBL fold metallo-hydrolase [Deinococcus aquatilis]